MQGGGNDVRDEKEGKAAAGIGKCFVQNSIAIPGPEEDLSNKLEVEMPPGGTLPRSLALQQILPAQGSEIETRERHDRVVKVILELEEELSWNVKGHDSVVVCAPKAGKEPMRDGKERNMLNIGVVFGLVGHDMMHVVASFPPPET